MAQPSTRAASPRSAAPAARFTADDARKLVQDGGYNHVKVALTDVDGILRGKYMSREKFFSSLEKGFAFCDVIVGWDSHDQLYDNARYTGWHTAYPDAPVRILPETMRRLPFENDLPFFLCELADQAEAVCPRALLRRMLDKAAGMGFGLKAAFEYEFFLFDETPHSVREKHYRNLTSLTPGFFGYSVLRNTVWSDLYHELLGTMQALDCEIEGLHTETGPGVLEAAIAVDEGLAAADKATLFRTFTKVIAQRNNLMATFMSKWSNEVPGQSGHIHMSMVDSKGKPIFHDPKDPHGMSAVMRHFVAGQQALMPEFLAMIAQTVNAYSRLVPGFWAPTSATWGWRTGPRRCA